MQNKDVLNIPFRLFTVNSEGEEKASKLTILYFKYITSVTRSAICEMENPDDYIGLSKYEEKTDEITDAIRDKTPLSKHTLLLEFSLLQSYIGNFFSDYNYSIISVWVGYRDENQVYISAYLKDRIERFLIFTFDDNNQISKICGEIHFEENKTCVFKELYNKDLNVLKSNWWDK
nr:MAG TPA: hypothetical protein [Caudoviricetes sp.]